MYETLAADVKAVLNGEGEPFSLDEWENAVVTLRAGAAATIKLQVSQLRSGTSDFEDYGAAAVNVTARIAITGAFARGRIVTTAYGAGTPAAQASGHSRRAV